jgi:oxygen-independent coproporphyrinogen-3 oxidase
VNRIQSTDDVQKLVDDARKYEYRSVSFDLIYGLPHQSVASFDATLDQAMVMRPDRLAIYNYAHLPERFKGQRMIHAKDLPSPETKLDILHHTIEKLIDAGYVYIGMDHFALPDDDLVLAKQDGTLQRNFQGYSTHGGSDLVALGVSAIGNIGNTYAQNSVSTIEYEALVSNKQLPIKKGLTVDEDDQIRAAAIQDIMCHDGIDYAVFGQQHLIDFREYFAAELERLTDLAQDDLIVVTDEAITVTAKGRLLLRSIAMIFDRYLSGAASDNRFSQAI